MFLTLPKLSIAHQATLNHRPNAGANIRFNSDNQIDLSNLGPIPQTMRQNLLGENVQIAWREYGNPKSNNVIICLHGFTRNSLDFDPLAQYLTQHQDCRVICPDIVGRGESGRFKYNAALKYNFLTYEEQLEKLLEHLQLKSPQKHLTIIGTSMGGIIGLQMAALHRFPISRLIMNDVGPDASMEMLNELAKMMAGDNDQSFQNLDEVKHYLKKRMSGLGELDDKAWDKIAKASIRYDKASSSYKLNYDPAITALFRQYHTMTRFIPPFSKFWLEMWSNFQLKVWGSLPLWSFWKNLRIPVLIIQGQNSPILKQDTIEKMIQSSNCRASSITFPGTGHAPPLIADTQNTLIDQWLKSTPAKS